MTRCHFGLLVARVSLRTTSANPEALDHPYAPAFGPYGLCTAEAARRPPAIACSLHAVIVLLTCVDVVSRTLT